MINNLGERIRLARKKQKFTQANLAQLIEISEQTLNKYEKGHRIPKAEILNRMANILNCNPGWLLSGEGDMISSSTPALGEPEPERKPLPSNLENMSELQIQKRILEVLIDFRNIFPKEIYTGLELLNKKSDLNLNNIEKYGGELKNIITLLERLIMLHTGGTESKKEVS
jgi:transcriptional regulator with XRE-family HTH domain